MILDAFAQVSSLFAVMKLIVSSLQRAVAGSQSALEGEEKEIHCLLRTLQMSCVNLSMCIYLFIFDSVSKTDTFSDCKLGLQILPDL